MAITNPSLRFLTAAWLALATAVSCAMAWYSAQPGRVGGLAEIAHAPAEQQWRLAVFVHPKCPCTLATISELERLLTQLGPRVTCTVYAFVPAASPGFAETALVARARRVPRVEVRLDEEGRAAAAAGAHTSGVCVLYDPTGQPRFIGGLTPSRGHEGDCVGKHAIAALVDGQPVAVTEAPRVRLRDAERR